MLNAAAHAMIGHISLVLFLALVLGGGLIIGSRTAPGAWYAGLTKPAFNPPAWLFGSVWTALYPYRRRRLACLAA
jgi:tryptophan-rich sensory protein